MEKNNKTAEDNLLPEWYTPTQEPFFQGKGCHNVIQLESICEQYKEFAHQLQIKFQNASLQSSEKDERIKELEKEVKKYRAHETYMTEGLKDICRLLMPNIPEDKRKEYIKALNL